MKKYISDTNGKFTLMYILTYYVIFSVPLHRRYVFFLTFGISELVCGYHCEKFNANLSVQTRFGSIWFDSSIFTFPKFVGLNAGPSYIRAP